MRYIVDFERGEFLVIDREDDDRIIYRTTNTNFAQQKAAELNARERANV